MSMGGVEFQVDDIANCRRLSFGEFDERFPGASPLIEVLRFVVESVGGWSSDRCVVAGHWVPERATAGWRPVTSFPYRRSLLESGSVQLSEVPDQNHLATAIECSWRLPRVLLCVIDRSAEPSFARLSSREWKEVLEEEIPSALLSLDVPMLILGFYHQRWVSAYLQPSEGTELAGTLLTRFGTELVPVRDNL